MQGVTLTIALAAGVLVFCLRPVYGLTIYIATLAWYPAYLTVPVGTIDFTVTRIVILAIYVNFLLKTNLANQFRFIWLDKLVIMYFLCQLLAMSVTTPMSQFLENRAGAFFDMVLPYFAVRRIITKREQYLSLLKGVLIIAAPLAIAGFYQCITSVNPVGFLRKYHAWKNAGDLLWPRYGLFRAEVTFSMSIMYGLFFAMFGPVCAILLNNAKKHQKLIITGLGLMAIGVFSSMSAGPFLAAILSVSFLVFYRWRKYWKTSAVIIIIICTFVEIASNRHFYDLLGSFTFNSATAWHRSKLINIALFEGGMRGHWFTGYGFADPGWGPKLGANITDITNHYILVLSRYGLIGLVPFILLVIESVKQIVSAFHNANSLYDNKLVWCLASSMCGTLVAMMTVSLFGQPITCFFILLGLCVVLSDCVYKNGLAVKTNL